MINDAQGKMHSANKRLIILCIAMAILLAAVLCVAILLNAEHKPQSNDPQGTGSLQTTAEQTKESESTDSVNKHSNKNTDPADQQEAGSTVSLNQQEEGNTLSVDQQDENMVVTTEYCTVSYPSAFIDVIQVSATEHERGITLEFKGNINERIVPLYFLWFNGESGQPVGSILDDKGQKISVSVEFFSLPENLTESEKDTFLAAQETVNDVLDSLKENETFIGM